MQIKSVVVKMENVVEVVNANKSFKNQNVFENVNLNVRQGEICGIVGANASGKSVLFKCITGLMSLDSGTIKVWDKNISNGRFAKDIGVILDCTGFLNNFSAYDNLDMIATINKIASHERINEVLRMVGLEGAGKKKVKKFSLGMKQKLAIAQAIMEKPKFLLLDEPMNGLDSESVKYFRELFLKMRDEDGVTILLTSHIAEDIDTLCDRVYRIADGKLHKAK